MYDLATYVTVDDGEHSFKQIYKIRNNGDYRTILDCLVAMGDDDLNDNEKIISSLGIFYEDINGWEDIVLIDDKLKEKLADAMIDFIEPDRYDIGYKTNYKIMDWEEDETIIVAAINNVAHTEIRSAEYIHWWTFLGYYMSIGESVFSTVVSIRDKAHRGKKLDKWEEKFKRDNPQYFKSKKKMAQEKADLEKIKNIWNGGSADG